MNPIIRSGGALPPSGPVLSDWGGAAWCFGGLV